MICPRCQKEVPDGPECASCGIVVAKYLSRMEQVTHRQVSIQAGAAQPLPLARVARTEPFTPERSFLFRPVSQRVLAGFYGEMSRLLQSGVSLTEALRLVAAHSRGRLCRAVRTICSRVESGEILAAALAAEPAVFPDTVRSMVEAGEETGGLPAVFQGLSESLELRLGLERRMLRACVYPFVLFTLSFFLIPISRLFLGGIRDYLLASLLPYCVALAALALILFGLPWVLRRVLGERASQLLLRNVPVLGALGTLRSTIRFSRHLSTALGAGLDMITSLHLAARATGDIHLVRKVEGASAEIQDGSTLSEALGRTGLFDGEFMLAISAGEISGRLEAALDQQGRLRQETFLHRLEIVVQLSAVFVLLLVYAYVAYSILGEYQSILGNTKAQLDQVMKEIGMPGGALPPGISPSEIKGLLP